MSSLQNIDIIDGLVKYVTEIKPFHTKIAEVLTNYVFKENLNVKFVEKLSMNIDMYGYITPIDTTIFGHTYGTQWDTLYTEPDLIVQTTLNEQLFISFSDDPNTNIVDTFY